MENKSFLITGGSSGVGRLLVDEISQKYKVITIARRIEKLQMDFGHNKNVFCYQADISNLPELEKVLQQIDLEHKNINCIVNCAGIMKFGAIKDLGMNDYNYSITVNALAPFVIIKHYIPQMIKNNFGRIINFTSGAPLNCFANYAAYSSSKSVLNSLTLTLAKELQEYDIRINLMSPGPVRTEMAPDAPMDPRVCLPTFYYLLDKVLDSGGFYWLGYKIPLSPDLEGIDWLHGVGNEKIEKIL